MKYPLVRICVVFCLGILIANFTKTPLIIFYLASASCVGLALFFKRRFIFSHILILAAILFLGACVLRNSEILPNSHIAKFTPYKSRYVYIKGVIDSELISKKKKVSFILKAEDVLLDGKVYKVCGKVLVNAYGRSDFRYGQKVIINGKLYKPFSLAISKRLDYRDYLRREGIYSILNIKKDSFVKYLEGNYANPIKSFAFAVKEKIKNIISANMSYVPASLLNAMLLGERKELPQAINDALTYSGTVHILAVSGLNVVIVAFIIIMVLKVLRVPRNIRLITAVFLSIIYAILTGAKPPVVRATIMVSILLFGLLFQKESDIYNSLSLAALFILGINPNRLFDISFQLSFISVFSIAWIYPKIMNLFPKKWFEKNLPRFLIETLGISFAAWVGTMGLVAYYFNIWTPIAIFANMILVPFMSLIIAAGFVLVVGAAISTFVSSLIASCCELLLAVILKINAFLISIPGAYFQLPSFSLFIVFLYYIGVFVLFRYFWGFVKTEESVDKEGIYDTI